jgi:bifunctional UDP-N-acetylglucosamine pyrophosphorylase/glucosamine-1-phosphate N-acetyltransferase
VLELDPEGYLTRIIEKPEVWSGNPLVNTGAFVLQPEVFAVLDGLQASARGEYEVVDIIQHLPSGERCKAVRTGEYWLPVGYPWKLLETNRFLLERSGGLPSGTRAGVAIEGPVIIGSGTVIEPGCTLGPWTTLGENCRVGAETSLINCLVMDGVQIGSGCHLEETILAHGAAVGDNVRTLTRPEEGPSVHSMVNGGSYDTGRATLGAVIGSDAQIAAGCQLYPGVKIWPGVKIAAGKQVRIDQVEQGFDTTVVAR